MQESRFPMLRLPMTLPRRELAALPIRESETAAAFSWRIISLHCWRASKLRGNAVNTFGIDSRRFLMAGLRAYEKN
ncbi:hypothetical protein BV898_15961 [Hypsibius exemplaris]|uniref:Uncharacterized protein n=1 Tax=Hypsibius exemplaris TaxID=2072580 RepID=A0A9X6NC79_HYPEX|nr:hypothetical protein BV898_15961 [Hypsibius exemplaris]